MKKDVVIYFISKIIIGIIGLVVLKLYSSMIDPAGYGEYSLVASLVTALISIFIGWIGSSALRYYDEYKDKKILLFTNITFYYIFMLMLCYIILYLCKYLMPTIPIEKYYIFIVFFTMTMSMQEILEKLLRASNKTVVYALASVVQSILSIILFYIIVKYTNLEAESIFISAAMSKAVFVIMSLFTLGYIIKFRGFRIDKKILKKFLNYGIPMIGVWGVGWILHYCDRYIISMYINNYEVGIYDMSCKISENTINLLISSFTLSIFPMLIRDWNKGGKKVIEDKFKTIVKYYNLIILPAVVGLILISDKLYLGIIDPKYASGKLVIIIISIGTFINGLNSILNKIWQLNEKTKNILYILIASVIINLVLNIILIPSMGINAAALTTLISYVFSIVVTYVFVRKEMIIKFDVKSFGKTIISCFVMSVFILIANTIVDSLIGLFIEVILAILIYVVSTLLLKNIDERIITSVTRRLKKHGN